jgi:hypothetical protein
MQDHLTNQRLFEELVEIQSRNNAVSILDDETFEHEPTCELF